jgi:hypothetical protein
MTYNPNPAPNYMGSDWGSSNVKTTALTIDHVADKAKFAIEMLDTALLGFDTIEKEIVDMSNMSVPPSRESIKALAYRIDSTQNQLKAGLDRLKQMMLEIDHKTDAIQKTRTSW